MKIIRKQNIIAAALFCVLTFTTAIAQSADPLPSWNESKASNPFTDFVTKVTGLGWLAVHHVETPSAETSALAEDHAIRAGRNFDVRPRRRNPT